METIRYHPLVDRDAEGTEKFPMFSTEDEAQMRDGNGFYLEEIVPKYYSLCAGKGADITALGTFTVHCPTCGKAMVIAAERKNTKRLVLYTCRECNS